MGAGIRPLKAAQHPIPPGPFFDAARDVDDHRARRKEFPGAIRPRRRYTAPSDTRIQP
jgi:hypothetical protein